MKNKVTNEYMKEGRHELLTNCVIACVLRHVPITLTLHDTVVARACLRRADD
jgi:hypothetical protein